MPKLCSIVIPTINRQDVVHSLLYELEAQSYKDLEIIVVDQTPSPDSELASKLGAGYVHLNEPGTPRARNEGVRASHGDIILFFDDDIELPNVKFVEQVMHFFATHPMYAGLGVTIIDKNEKLNRENQSFNDRVMEVTWSGRVLPFARGTHEKDIQAPRGGGMAFRRDAVEAVGGFDSRYVGNAMREETDFSLRVIKKVGPIRYIPSLEVIHLALPRGGSRSQNRKEWYRDFFANEFLFVLSHAPLLALFPFFMRKLRPILACMFWYGKGRPRALVTPFVGFYDGYRRYKKGFTSFSFS